MAAAQVVALGPFAALTVPFVDAGLAHTEANWDKKKEKGREEKDDDQDHLAPAIRGEIAFLNQPGTGAPQRASKPGDGFLNPST